MVSPTVRKCNEIVESCLGTTRSKREKLLIRISNLFKEMTLHLTVEVLRQPCRTLVLNLLLITKVTVSEKLTLKGKVRHRLTLSISSYFRLSLVGPKNPLYFQSKTLKST